MWITIYTLLSILSCFQKDGMSSAAVPPVKFEIFYEALCPDSVFFIAEILQPMYGSLKTVINVQIYAYGRVTESYHARNKTYTFQCYHGPDECRAHKVLECAKKYIRNQATYLKFISCIISSKNPADAGQTCSRSNRVSYTPIRRCSTSKEGNQLFHQAGVIQKRKVKILREIPFILVNGKFTRFIGMNVGVGQTFFLQQVCGNYKGNIPSIKWFSIMSRSRSGRREF